MSEEPVKSRRPENTAFKQQRLASWQPILTPEIAIVLFLVIGIIFIPIGTSLKSISDEVYEDRITYDGDNAKSGCGITTSDDGSICSMSFTITEDVTGPLMVYYELKNFYQNHRRYVSSRSADQLMGVQLASSDLELDCDPLYMNGSLVLNPCGLVANSFFNDVIELTSLDFTMDETDISWESDREKKFLQPDGFESKVKGGSGCDAGWTETNYDGIAYCYRYPEEDKYQYLYETYPQISPLKGVTDEHFIVWMRTAGLPNFRKLYGRIDADLKKGDVLNFDVTQNFEVSSFDGTKSIVISTVGKFGGKNPFLGVAYIVVGSISLFFGCVFLAKHLIAPRKMGDISKLHWS